MPRPSVCKIERPHGEWLVLMCCAAPDVCHERTARGQFTRFATCVETRLRAASTWGFDIPDVAKRGDVRARILASRGLSTHFATCVEAHLRAASTWGFDIPDVTKRGDVSAK